MNKTIVYRREADNSTDSITVMAYLGADDNSKDEIRVIHASGGEVTSDSIAFCDYGGEQWLNDRDEEWLRQGFRLTTVENE
ncbi:hypothetical protein AB0M36_07615 [Actinoplanes sp. NPDC051346]|uniref:hypothetical protein n=1 Tax=Actinoplanes sp. NPDC051346 TaxID=3155048 RepID=UPI00342F67D3